MRGMYGSSRFARLGVTAGMVRGAQLARVARFGSAGMAAYAGYRGIRGVSKFVRRVKARRQVGDRIGSTSAKQRLLEGSDTIDSKTLSDGLRLLSLPKTTTNDESVRNDRQRNAVDFRGVKICFNIDINEVTGSTGDKLFFNWAVISPKQLDNEITTIPTEEWFRGQDGARFTSFIGTTLTGLDCHCLPINTDKYIIHRHKRITMGPWESPNGMGERYFEEYVPVKRQIRYNATGTGTQLDYPEGKDMWMVYWVSKMNEPTGAPITNLVTIRFRIMQIFRDPLRS